MKKPIIDFNILPNDDPRFISVMDASVWHPIENKPSIIEITLPGGSKPSVTHEFTKGSIHTFNSKNLLADCAYDPCGTYDMIDDGFYKITVKGSPDDFNKCKTYLHTANTRLKLDILFSKAYLDCNSKASKESIERIKEIDFLIRAAEANTRLDLISSAQNLFMRAQDLIDSKCNNGC